MDNFINLIKNMRDIKANKAEETIIRGLMVQNKRQNDKLEDLDSYDSESLFNGKMYRGNMYIFTYSAKNPTKYSYKGEDIYFADSLPVVLMTGETQSTIRGINLNFCNKALKTLILNILTNMDEDFYFGDLAQKQAFNKQVPISEKVYRFLSSNGAEEKIIEHATEEGYAGFTCTCNYQDNSFRKEARKKVELITNGDENTRRRLFNSMKNIKPEYLL